jgi:hypothetical protein
MLFGPLIPYLTRRDKVMDNQVRVSFPRAILGLAIMVLLMSPPGISVSSTSSLAAAQQDILCGFVGQYGTVDYGFHACSRTTYLFAAPGDPVPSGYYKMYDPVTENRGGLPFITGWSRLEPIPDCNACSSAPPPPPTPADIRITNFTITPLCPFRPAIGTL